MIKHINLDQPYIYTRVYIKQFSGDRKRGKRGTRDAGVRGSLCTALSDRVQYKLNFNSEIYIGGVFPLFYQMISL